MEGIFEQMKQEKKNTVDNLVKWMQDAKIVDNSKDALAKAKDLFKDVSDKNNVEFAKFKEAAEKAAAEKNMNLADLSKSLEGAASTLKGMLGGAAKALSIK